MKTTRIYRLVNGVLFRIAEEDKYLNDVLIGKGTMVTTQPLGNHFNSNTSKILRCFILRDGRANARHPSQ